MSDKNFGSSIQIAQKLVGRLPKETDDELRSLIQRGEEGVDVSIELIDLLSPHETVRRWMKEQISIKTETKGVMRSYTPLGGDQSSIPVSQLWVCPQEGCDESLPVIQAGEDAPTCKKCKVEMIRGNEKKG